MKPPEGKIQRFQMPGFYLACWKGDFILSVVAARNPFTRTDKSFMLLAVEGSARPGTTFLDEHAHLELGKARNGQEADRKARRFMRRWLSRRDQTTKLCDCGPINPDVAARLTRKAPKRRR